MTLFPRERNGESTTRLLAGIVIDCTNNPPLGLTYQTELNNAFRLLETYRPGRFRAEPENNFLYDAFERTFSQVFPDLIVTKSSEKITTTIRKLAYPLLFQKIEKEELDYTRRFFEQLKKEVTQ